MSTLYNVSDVMCRGRRSQHDSKFEVNYCCRHTMDIQYIIFHHSPQYYLSLSSPFIRRQIIDIALCCLGVIVMMTMAAV